MPGEILRVGACSIAAVPGDTDGNIEKLKQWTRQAVDEKVELLLFPELSLSGYWCSKELLFEAQPRDGPAIKELVAFLNELDSDIAISVGLAEKYGGCVYNCQVLLDRNGERYYYRKTHWPHAEMGTWSCGDRYPVHKFQAFNIGTAICYDNNFPEIHRIYGLEGADLVLCPYAYGGKFDPADMETVKKSIFDWKDKERYYLRCAAQTNYLWIVSCVGGGHVVDYHKEKEEKDGLEYYFPGVIFFIAPDGKVLKESPDDEIAERLLWMDISVLANMEQRRSDYNHFKDRRTATYGRVCELP
ncbi:MAG TPA: nitrilase-related carbon-nitrogen hydrolase [Candidatus Lokiarchaeia archaeon]|nr:nitrilase-related carbon-nitrogen hydrolase [Candidatus Lokiarchaeia archaeon]